MKNNGQESIQTYGNRVHFLLSWETASKESLKLVHSIDELGTTDRGLFFCDQNDTEADVIQYTINGATLYVIGDPVFPLNIGDEGEFLFRTLLSNDMTQLGGFYYIIMIDKGGKRAHVANGSFGVLPVYIFKQSNKIVLSSKTSLIRQFPGAQVTVDHSYIFQRCLFNYAFQNRTYWDGIETIPAHTLTILEESLQLVTYWNPENDLVDAPLRGKKALKDLSDQFTDTLKKYLPQNKYAVSFTGGFDGRTLTAGSQYLNKDFLAYSFGSADSTDLTLPRDQSACLGIEFLPILLGSGYLNEHSYDDGMNLILLTEGNASMARAHYLYAVKLLSEKVKYIVTGNFGSEVFRAAHIAGVVLSKELFDVIGCQDLGSLGSIFTGSCKTKYLNPSIVRDSTDALIDEATKFREKYKYLTPNQLLYVFNMNEMFRKYFGPEIVMQTHFVNNRSPFLDYDFIKQVMQTHYCGAYSDYRTDNPIKRYKGQQPYAHIIKKLSPILYGLPTNKGYKPSDLISASGKLRLILNIIRKRLKHSTIAADPYSVSRAFRYNLEKLKNVSIPNSWYNVREINELVGRGNAGGRDIYLSILSTCIYLQSEGTGAE